ncbi:MAG: hypothetical protein JOY82_15215 [Streptosporangiaceae bacterium]|nr:hypothetical protein [Streptosporangiaceae bacterium]MBV9855841.1 hypothetical protein [Streptosporangiaceae bacterium]
MLAKAAGCWLVVLCSRHIRAADVGVLFSDMHLSKGLAVDIPGDYSHPLLNFKSSDLARSGKFPFCVNPNGDLSTKRNLGLLLARMLGWDRIFFMDDDIREVPLSGLRATVSMLDRYRSAGMRVTDYADNSVVCHAHRATGAKQDVFVSGSVLAVSCQRDSLGFFPEIYNEDWLFFYDDAHAMRLGWSECDVTQLEYDPFKNVQRAERQEFGDILAEGLYALLHVGFGPAAATADYWSKFLTKRREFLEGIIYRSGLVAPEIQQNIVRAVQTAIFCLIKVQAQTCADYITEWRKDLRVWAERLKTVPRVNSVEAAIAELELGNAVVREPYDLPDMLDAAVLATRIAMSNLLSNLPAVRLTGRIEQIPAGAVYEAPASEPPAADAAAELLVR